jgi:hypothetical protein
MGAQDLHAALYATSMRGFGFHASVRRSQRNSTVASTPATGTFPALCTAGTIGALQGWAAETSQDLNGFPMPTEKTLSDLFLDTLKDIYFAEKQILKALPKMARAAQSEEGKAGFLQHREETQGQIERLEQIFELLG